jgi:hypothetical protein
MARRIFAAIFLLLAILFAVGGVFADYIGLVERGADTIGDDAPFMHGLMFGGEPMTTLILTSAIAVFSIIASSLRSGLPLVRPIAGSLPALFLVALGLCGVLVLS